MKVKTFLMTDISIINEELLKKLKKGDLLYETNNINYRHSCRLTHQKILKEFSTDLRLKNNLLFVENTVLPGNIKNFPYFQIILSYFLTYDGRLVVEIYNGKNILIKNIYYQFNLIFYRKVKSNSLVEIYPGELSF